MILETFPAVNALTVDQKLRLACELVQDVSREETIPNPLGEMLEDRLRTYDADPTQVRSTDGVAAGVLELKQRLSARSA
jgi:hypothetical protein